MLQSPPGRSAGPTAQRGCTVWLPDLLRQSDRENACITDLFCERQRRYLAGEPPLNVLNTRTLY
ncbi:MAG TPA: hypothetical protein PLO33_10865 [Kouleothrix sp.]|uniref:hypothetical protein n=1 Tax=Kouleothrix sp. TaxID=2779161 RepID=UPI002D1624C8|nr:hypothetical protein [Kouleothrix sp.]